MLNIELTSDKGQCESCGATNDLGSYPGNLFTSSLFSVNTILHGKKTPGKLILCEHCVHLLKAVAGTI